MAQIKTPWGEAGRKYLEEFAPIHLAPLTRQKKATVLGLFLRWSRIESPSDLDRARLMEYQRYRLVECGKSPHTVNGEIAHLLGFVRWCQDHDYIDADRSFRIRRVPALPPEHADDCSSDDVRGMIEAVIRAGRWWLADLVILARYCGLRLSEVLALRVCDANLAQGLVWIARPKNRKPRAVKLNRMSRAALKRRIEGRQYEQYLFTTRTGKRVMRRNALRALQTFARARGFPKVTFQMLRRVFATVNAQRCTPNELMALMGHSSPVVTAQNYIRIQAENLPTPA